MITEAFTECMTLSIMYILRFFPPTGTRCRALGGYKTHASIPQVLNGPSQDGFMHVTCRSTGVEPLDEQKIHYDVSTSC